MKKAYFSTFFPLIQHCPICNRSNSSLATTRKL